MTDPTATQTGALERELFVAASLATVFAYWVDPDRMTRWMGRDARLDPRPGGEFRVEYNDTDVARGTYLDVDPPHRVVFTWGWEAPDAAVPPGASVVEVTLEADGDGTRLRLVHGQLPEAEVPTHGEGWDYFLGRLVEAI